MDKLTDISTEIRNIFPDLAEKDIGEYSLLVYPKVIHMLKMKVKSYSLPGFGSVMSMDTSMMGLMKLSTISFTPDAGMDIPFLLIDTMSMGKKRLAYFELYDCRKEKNLIQELEALKEKYKDIKDYEEKENWYVHERMNGSLIKCSDKKGEQSLCDMLLDALHCYRSCMDKAGKNKENLEGLIAFRDRMINEGNPSSSTLEKVLGKEKSVDFFKTVVMSIEDKQ